MGKTKTNMKKGVDHPAWRRPSQLERRANANTLPPSRIKKPRRSTTSYNESDLSRRRAQYSEELATNLQWHNGPVLHNPTVYVIFYGPWITTAKTIVTDFLDHLSGSAYYGIQTTYFDLAGYLDDKLSFTKTTNVYHDASRSQGRTLTEATIPLVITNAIAHGGLDADPNGIYLLLADSASSYTGPDLDFCVESCGYHDSFLEPSTLNTYAFGIIVDPTICGEGCGLQAISPNGNPGVDALLSTVAHEIVEAASDPFSDPASWYSSETGDENADICSDFYGDTYDTASGAEANVRLGERDFLIQQNFVNAGTTVYADSCQTSLPYLTLSIDNSVSHAASSAISISWTVNSAVTFPLKLSSSANNYIWTFSSSTISPHLTTLSSTPYDHDGKTTFKLCDSHSYCSDSITISLLTLAVDGVGLVVAPGSSVSYSWSYAGSTNVATSPLTFKLYLNNNIVSTTTKSTSSGTSTLAMPLIAGAYSYKLCDSNSACATPVTVVVGTLSLTSTATTLAAGSNVKYSWSSSGVTFPLTFSIWDSATDTIFYALYVSDSLSTAASGTSVIKIPPFLWRGDYHIWLCDANWACVSNTLTIAMPLSEVNNKADLLLGEYVYSTSSTINDNWMAYAIWSDALVSIYVTDGVDCDIANLPENYWPACSHDEPVSSRSVLILLKDHLYVYTFYVKTMMAALCLTMLKVM